MRTYEESHPTVLLTALVRVRYLGRAVRIGPSMLEMAQTRCLDLRAHPYAAEFAANIELSLSG